MSCTMNGRELDVKWRAKREAVAKRTSENLPQKRVCCLQVANQETIRGSECVDKSETRIYVQKAKMGKLVGVETSKNPLGLELPWK